MIRLLRRLLDGPDDGLPAQLARLKAECADLAAPVHKFDGCRQEAKRHAAATVCHKCGMLTGFNDGVQPCGACFADDLERVQSAIESANGAANQKIRRVK